MAFVDVIRLPSGRFAVREIGQDLPRILDDFETRTEAEEWLMRNMSPGGEGHIYKPGDGEGVA